MKDNMKELTIGTEAVLTYVTEESRTAQQMGSGSLAVLATPAVVALMEKAACMLLAPYLPDDMTTVGTKIAVEHLSATPVGAAVTVKAVLTAIEDRKYCFDVTAEDIGGLIAQGQHERFLVKTERFLAKTYQKLEELSHA